MKTDQVFRQFISKLTAADFFVNDDQLFSLSSLKDKTPKDDESILHEIISCFLILLGDVSNPEFELAESKFSEYEKQKKWHELISFLSIGLSNIPIEIRKYSEQHPEFISKIVQADQALSENQDNFKILESLRNVFFPEGAGLDDPDNRSKKIEELRQKRRICIEKFNPGPIKDPVREMIFTSNMLLTVPLTENEDDWHLNGSLKSRIKQAMQEKQKYWYDHPIPLGIAPEKNEVLYGLQGLEEMLQFEIEQNSLPDDARLTVILSASTTHNGIHPLVKDYFEYLLEEAEPLPHINLYIFSEDDTARILDEVLIPIAKHFGMTDSTEALKEVFGVDGEYGRHYSFLKAITALWQVFINPEIKATFKIDLDQVFPQQELLEQGGYSALQHFTTSLWGASGRDEQGRKVELSMIAGTLVNHNDIEKSLFFPDVTFPAGGKLSADGLIFHSPLPQAQSTEAEMMARYDDKNLEGKNEVIQRVHVTGGTNGILIKALRRHRPFTPTIIGRAEDQAYLLSVLFSEQPALRYLHKPGLIMRHDKHIFAGEAISAAAAGKRIGDYIRILLFSYYGKALPWSMEKTKDMINPFTGCFMSSIPITIVYLRFTFEILAKVKQGSIEQAIEFALSGAQRLGRMLDWLLQNENPIQKIYEQEKAGWNLYYDVLDAAERTLRQKDQFVIEMQEKVKRIIRDSFINTQ